MNARNHPSAVALACEPVRPLTEAELGLATKCLGGGETDPLCAWAAELKAAGVRLRDEASLPALVVGTRELARLPDRKALEEARARIAKQTVKLEAARRRITELEPGLDRLRKAAGPFIRDYARGPEHHAVANAFLLALAIVDGSGSAHQLERPEKWVDAPRRAWWQLWRRK